MDHTPRKRDRRTRPMGARVRYAGQWLADAWLHIAIFASCSLITALALAGKL